MKINLTMSLADQNAICERCPLPDCVGIENSQCQIQVEQRLIWRADYERRKAAGYFAGRKVRKQEGAAVYVDSRVV